MKKNFKKLIMELKIAFLLIILSISNVLARNSFSQTARISLEMKGATLEQVMDEIEKQSNFYFVFNQKQIDVNRIVDIKAENEPITDILPELFMKEKINYAILNRKILLTTEPLESNLVSFVLKNQNQQQQITVTGKVTDSQTGEPIAGVNVVVKGTTTGTMTDVSGNYSLNVPDKNAALVFSFVGYATQEIPLEGRTTLNVSLVSETIGLEEVVVIGYGTMRKSDLTGAVSMVKGNELAEKVSTTRISQALQGITPGLMVTRAGASDPSVSATIRIRGVTTIGESAPLVIVDGIPGTLDWVNANDVESISVLKDAASASIYGSRAAAGVIVVTTKKAKEGELSISYNYNHTFEQPTRMTTYTDAVGFMKLYNELLWNDSPAGGEYQSFSKDLIDNYPDLHAQDPDHYPDNDYHDLMLKKWITKNSHVIGLSAGSKYIKTYFSLNLDDTEGLYMGKSYDRYTLRSNNNVTINKYFSADVNFNGLYSINNDAILNTYNTLAVKPLQILGPIYPAEWSDGRVAPGKGGENPYAILKYGGNDKTKASVFNGKFQFNFTPIDNLIFSASYAAEMYNSKGKNFRKKIPYTNFEDPSTIAGYIWYVPTTRLQENRSDRLSQTMQFLANYQKRLNIHNIKLMAGYEENSNFNESLNAVRDEYELTNFPYLDLGNPNFQTNGGSAWEYANRSFFGRLNYDFDNKYLFQGNLRYDGSSRFHKDCRWGLFPSVSVGWIISKENFMKKISIIDFLKIRASYGSLGNERIGNYPYQSTIGFTTPLLYKGTSVVGAQGAGIMDYAIPDITWETTVSYGLGFDINLFKNKLSVTADYYKKNTKDMLLPLEIPDYIGLNNPQQNTGKMFTKGWELSVGWSDRMGNLKYSVSAHISDSKSIMGYLGGTEFLGSQVKFEGSEYNEWYGYKSDGLYQTEEEVNNSAKLYKTVKPGDVKYVDISGPDGVPDGIISATYDRILLGGSLPRYLYGGDINLDYRNFSFVLVFQGIGKQIAKLNTSWLYPFYEFPTEIVGTSWSKYNTAEQNLRAKYPRYSQSNNSNNYAMSDFWLINGAYFRLKNISLAYNVNVHQRLVSSLKLSSLRIFVNASDLFSIDHFPKDWDPETTSSYWVTRAFTLGISVKF